MLSTTTTVPPPPGQDVTAIGDSIMVDAAPYLKEMLPGIVVDAQVGQQLYQVQAEVPQLKSAGDIGDRLILELGTNGYYSVTQLDNLLTSLGPMTKIVLVNTRVPQPWEQPVNQTIATVAQSHPNVTLVDWYDDSANDPAVLLSRRRPPQSHRRQVLRLTHCPGSRGAAAESPNASLHRVAAWMTSPHRLCEGVAGG